MPTATDQILGWLAAVDGERQSRNADPELLRSVMSVKRYQQNRFRMTYADLLASSRYGRSAEFFLNDLYGPNDFADRDRQFARITPKLVRLMPPDVVATVADLTCLHAISEQLDTAMGRAVAGLALTPAAYVAAWNVVGQRTQRTRQVELVISIGHALDRFTRHAWITTTLKLMRGPAHAAGMAALQTFLEAGMSSFQAMHGAAEFLATVERRETQLMDALFAAPRTAIDVNVSDARKPDIWNQLPVSD